MIQIEKLWKGCLQDGKRVVALDGIDLEVPHGEICVLLGPSGCGKTTTLKIINRLVTPTGGRVLVDGQDTGQFDVIELRRKIGYVIQQVGLFPHMTVEENIGIVPRLLDWPGERRHKRSLELLELTPVPEAPLIVEFHEREREFRVDFDGVPRRFCPLFPLLELFGRRFDRARGGTKRRVRGAGEGEKAGRDGEAGDTHGRKESSHA